MGDAEPMDLSRGGRKALPPLIPISLLRPRPWPLHEPRAHAEGPKRLRLDRARSVPQLAPLGAQLTRAKSLSEGRIALRRDDWLPAYCAHLLHAHVDRQLQMVDAEENSSAKQSPDEGSPDLKRKTARPMTGKHVRPGTGASPATLLTLRRKIQERQQHLDSKKLH